MHGRDEIRTKGWLERWKEGTTLRDQSVNGRIILNEWIKGNVI